MSSEPYCVWCNRIGHEPTDQCRGGRQFAAASVSTLLEERERCAKIAERIGAETGDGEGEIYIARKIADAIRAPHLRAPPSDGGEAGEPVAWQYRIREHDDWSGWVLIGQHFHDAIAADKADGRREDYELRKLYASAALPPVPGNEGREAIEQAKAYVENAIASYIGDPADNRFQEGFLAALEVVRDEAFSRSEENTP